MVRLPKLLPLVAAVLLPVVSAAKPGWTFAYPAHYLCQGGQTLQVATIKLPSNGEPGSSFVLLTYKGHQYGLAQAISASGARYAALYGPTAADAGLEWWEHGGEGTLSKFTGKDFWATTPLLEHCKLR